MFVLVAAKPLPRDTPSKRRINIEAVAKADRGIDWGYAAHQRGIENFQALVEATRMALVVTNFHMNGKYSESPAWNRYFVSDKKANPANGWNIGIGKPNIVNEPVNPVKEGDLDLGRSTIPANCHLEDGDVESAVCHYVGEDYDVFVDRLDEPFEARNSECILS
ncbi:hypothetical protein FQN53_004606 [Emmonsiellopsis sp. PD_33]|nr:hypothetical protein FQN53_004606 [Emmonsiellopsis sp. PD_33]